MGSMLYRFGHGNGTKILEVIECFAIQKNFTNLIKIQNNEDAVKGVHGLRFLNAVALLLVHKSMGLLYNPYINRAAMAEVSKKLRVWVKL